MNSFEIYRIATNQWNKAMKYHDNIDFDGKKKGQKISDTKSFKERKIQKIEYDKAIFYYKLYEYVARLEEREFRNNE